MHKSSYLRMNYLINYYLPHMNKDIFTVLDIGSYNQNGTYKDIFTNLPCQYVGMDMSEGPNVDIVPKDIYSWREISDNSFDMVISGQCFEHIEYPWLTMKEIARVLKPSGLCIIIAPNAGIEHKAPLDCYRFFSDGLIALAKWANLSVHHTSVAGILGNDNMSDWISEWNDAVLVAQKYPINIYNIPEPFIYEQRWHQDGTTKISYKNIQIAINEITKKYNDGKKYILFGAGIFGKSVLDLFGIDRIYCYCDNKADKIGKKIEEKEIISLEQLKKIHSNYHIVVTANYSIAQEIRQQLKENAITSDILSPELYA